MQGSRYKRFNYLFIYTYLFIVHHNCLAETSTDLFDC